MTMSPSAFACRAAWLAGEDSWRALARIDRQFAERLWARADGELLLRGRSAHAGPFVGPDVFVGRDGSVWQTEPMSGQILRHAD